MLIKYDFYNQRFPTEQFQTENIDDTLVNIKVRMKLKIFSAEYFENEIGNRFHTDASTLKDLINYTILIMLDLKLWLKVEYPTHTRPSTSASTSINMKVLRA